MTFENGSGSKHWTPRSSSSTCISAFDWSGHRNRLSVLDCRFPGHAMHYARPGCCRRPVPKIVGLTKGGCCRSAVTCVCFRMAHSVQDVRWDVIARYSAGRWVYRSGTSAALVWCCAASRPKRRPPYNASVLTASSHRRPDMPPRKAVALFSAHRMPLQPLTTSYALLLLLTATTRRRIVSLRSSDIHDRVHEYIGSSAA